MSLWASPYSNTNGEANEFAITLAAGDQAWTPRSTTPMPKQRISHDNMGHVLRQALTLVDLLKYGRCAHVMSYCHCTQYLANHDPSTYVWNKYALAALYFYYLFVYWVWDNANSQQNSFRMERGIFVKRKTFPQLPW